MNASSVSIPASGFEVPSLNWVRMPGRLSESMKGLKAGCAEGAVPVVRVVCIIVVLKKYDDTMMLFRNHLYRRPRSELKNEPFTLRVKPSFMCHLLSSLVLYALSEVNFSREIVSSVISLNYKYVKLKNC